MISDLLNTFSDTSILYSPMTIWFHSMSLSSIPKRTRWGYKNDYLPVEIYFKITIFAH